MNDATLRIRLPAAEKRAMQAAADAAGLRLSVWVRRVLSDAADAERIIGGPTKIARRRGRVMWDSDDA